MSVQSTLPTVALFDANGVEVAVASGVSIPTGTKGVLLAGADGTTARFAYVDSAGRITIVGAGTAGTPGGGVLSVQGVVGGTVIPVSVSALPLPTGAATEATLATLLTLTGFQARVNTLGQKTMANSTPVVFASDQTSVPVTDNGGSITTDTTQLPAALVGGRIDTNNGAWLGSTAPTVGQKVMGSSLPVTFASDQTALSVTTAANSYGGQIEGRAADNAAPVGNPVWVAGDDGSILRALRTDSAGRLIIAPPGTASATAGFALGTMTTTAITDVPVRATTYTEPSTNAQRSISSASANDAAAGTGARQVRITYYDQTGAGPSTEIITLNGTTPVNTVSTTVCFIEKIEVTSVGSGGVNAGIITLFAATAGGGGAIGTIAASANRTFWAQHYTPTGKTTFITGLSGNNNNASNGTIYSIRAKAVGANNPELVISDYIRGGAGSQQSTRTYGTPIQITGPARIILYGAPEGTPSIISRASFDYYDQ